MRVVTSKCGSKRRSGRAHTLWMAGNISVGLLTKTKNIPDILNAAVKYQEGGCFKHEKTTGEYYIPCSTLVIDFNPLNNMLVNVLVNARSTKRSTSI